MFLLENIERNYSSASFLSDAIKVYILLLIYVIGVCSSVLLERVFLRLGSAESDEQLEAVLAKFLTPVLLKLASQTDGVRKKVLSTYTV